METALLNEILLNEIRQDIHTVRRIRESLLALRNSVIAAKGSVRGLIGQKNWSETIMDAKNLTYFLAKDIQGTTDQMIETIEDIDELEDLLNNMKIQKGDTCV